MKMTYDYSDHRKVLSMVTETQDAETDQRGMAREAKDFVTKRDGQWTEDATRKMIGRVRMTFDMCTAIVDQTSGEIANSDFTLRVSPSGGEASEDHAKILDGMIRNIRNVSNAERVFKDASRSNVVSGFDCWEVVQDYVDGDSFNQDLFIKRVPSALDCVWFDPASVEQDRSDAQWAVKRMSIPKANYEAEYPDGSRLSIGDDQTSERYWGKIESVEIGQLYYKKPRDIEIVQMSDGAVYQVNEDFEMIVDELAAQGITETDRRVRKSWRVYSRLYDGGNWLGDEEETVFDYIPLVPIYGNFDIVDSKVIYSGEIEKLIDHQRALNYSMSRAIEDNALSPAAFDWMTDKMAEGNDYSKMNTDGHRVRIFNVDDEMPMVPQRTAEPQASPGLQANIANLQQMINSTANKFNAQQGNAMAGQSGVAGLQQIEQGNLGSVKWFDALEIPICHTGKILINAIPRVYDSTRQVRLLGEDGAARMEVLNKPQLDVQTGKNITLNDLSIGEYDTVCEVGPAFNSQQKETAQAFLDMASINPEVSQRGMDLWLRNIKTPGMDLMADRFRQTLLEQGAIPFDQMTEEEQAQTQQAAQQPPQPDPMMVATQAEMQKAQTESQKTQVDAQLKMKELEIKEQAQQIELAKVQLQQQQFEREGNDKYNVEAAKIDQGQQKIDLDYRKMVNDMAIKIETLEQQHQQSLRQDIINNQNIASDSQEE